MKTMHQQLVRLAYAEDSPFMRDSVSNILKQTGCFEINIAVKDGEELIASLKEATVLPDICIIDIDMRVKYGYQTTKEIKAEWPKMKLLILTEVNSEYSIITMLKHGVNGYLLKVCKNVFGAGLSE